jgi:hypothetical protein
MFIMKGRKLKPWVKVALAFIIGVVAVSQVFKLTGSEASEGESGVFHGVVEMELNGEAHLKMIDGAYDMDISLKMKEGYNYFEIITVVLEDGEVVNDYLTYGKELDALEKKHKFTIQEYRQSIADLIYE